MKDVRKNFQEGEDRCPKFMLFLRDTGCSEEGIKELQECLGQLLKPPPEDYKQLIRDEIIPDLMKEHLL